ncbi:MAG: hypothetical protein HY280_06595 [Nitrospinae bacterium]|nr:hypothetical protein [Nitrospinota bacterium]
MKTLKFIAAFSCIFWATAAIAGSADFGIVMDVSGNATANKKAVDLGQNVTVGESLSVPAAGRLVVVGYKGCSEWKITGPAKVTVLDAGPELAKGSTGKIEHGRKMPACYKPADLKTASTHEQGALVLMNKKDTGDLPSPPQADAELSATVDDTEQGIEQMRKDFVDGKSDVPALMSLVMHDLEKNDKDKARPYFAELQKRAPKSSFVKKLEKEFN